MVVHWSWGMYRKCSSYHIVAELLRIALICNVVICLLKGSTLQGADCDGPVSKSRQANVCIPTFYIYLIVMNDFCSHAQHSMIIVPADTPGVKMIRPMMVFGFDGCSDHCHIIIAITLLVIRSPSWPFGDFLHECSRASFQHPR